MTARRQPIEPSPPLTDEEGEVRELTAEDMARFRPSSDFPDLARLFRQGRPPLPPEQRKRRVTRHLDPDVLERLKEGGRGWQKRANAMLRKGLGL